MLNDKELEKLLLEAQELLNGHTRLAEDIENDLMENRVTSAGQKEVELDAIYQNYWNLLHTNFDKDIFNKVQNSIGVNKFISINFLDELEDVYKGLFREICSYQGYALKRGKDCFGSIGYFVFVKDVPYTGSLDFYDDEGAIQSFKSAINENPGNPIFF